MICKCCGKEAVWCGDGTKLYPEKHHCDHIHCDHCGMHYSLEGVWQSDLADTIEECREIMLRVYNGGQP